MSGTVRTLSAIDALFSDNTAGDISAQDLRDFLWSSLLETDAQSPTTGNITGAAGKHYELDISGLTANRDFTLPASAAVGSMIAVTITTGDPDYELVLKGAATVTINNGSAATEWSRLFQDNESVLFRASSATNWNVVADKRIPAYAKIEGDATNDQTVSSSAGVYTENGNLQTTAYNYGCNITTGSRTTPTASRIGVRRAGTYYCQGQWSPYSNPSDQDYAQAIIYGGDYSGSSNPAGTSKVGHTGTATPFLTFSGPLDLAAGDDVWIEYRSQTTNVGVARWNANNLTVTELL